MKSGHEVLCSIIPARHNLDRPALGAITNVNTVLCRQCAADILHVHHLDVDGLESPAVGLAVQLCWVFIISQPTATTWNCLGGFPAGTISTSTHSSAKPWHKPLQQATEVAANIILLQRSMDAAMHAYTEPPNIGGQRWIGAAVLPGTTDGGQGRSVHQSSVPRLIQELCTPGYIGSKYLGESTALSWPAAGAADLQLCLSGLHQLLVALNNDTNPKCHPMSFYRSILDIKAAVEEYNSSSQPKNAVWLLRNCATLDERTKQVRLIHVKMLVEVMRALRWCIWLLGVHYFAGEVDRACVSSPV